MARIDQAYKLWYCKGAVAPPEQLGRGLAWGTESPIKSSALDTTDKFSFTFATPGTYEYFCSLHPHMTGTVVVEAAAAGNAAQ